MNAAIKIILASLLALFIQYSADIVSLMATTLCSHDASNYIQSMLVAIFNVAISFLLFKYCALKWFRINPASIGLTISKRAVLVAILLLGILFSALFFISIPMASEYIVVQTEQIGVILFNSFINKGISTAIGEELIFRGFLFSYILSLTNPSKAFIISILVFTLPHMLVFEPSLTAFFIFINYTAVSVLLTALYYKTKSIFAPIIFHALYNFILYGIWNVANTGEPCNSVFTTIMNEPLSNSFILIFATCQLLLTYSVFKLKPLITR